MWRVFILVLFLDIFLQDYFRAANVGVLNQGISFGMFPGTGQTIAVVIYLLFVIVFLKKFLPSGRNAFLMLAIGGLGNLIPRMVWGGVWDYIHFPGVSLWFNLSDVMICLGVISYILSSNGDSDSV